VSDEWARTSITVYGRSGEVEQTVEFDGETLDEQLHAAEWLGGRAGSASESELPQVRLLTSWSPADGRHAMSLSPTLVRALAGAGGTFWMDVYPYVD
jgi:hypothetical protein